MLNGFKQKIIAFASGFACAVLAVLAFFLGRKKGVADMDGVRPDYKQYDDCAERTESVSGRIGTAQDAITDSIRILEEARKRAEEENTGV